MNWSQARVKSEQQAFMVQSPNRLLCLSGSGNETYTIILCFMNVKLNARQKK